MIGFRIPSRLLEEVDRQAVNGKTRTDVLVELLEKGLGMSSTELDSKPSSDRLADVEQLLRDRLSNVEQTLSDRIAKIEQLLSDRISPAPKPISDRLSNVERPRENRLESESIIRSDIADDPMICRNCGASELRREGFGKLRADGTRGQRWWCRSCGKNLVY